MTDLSKFPALLAAYDNLGKESLALACENPRFLSKLGREAARAENYGGNNDDEGYTNMVDLGHFVRNATNLLPESSADLLEALDDCIVYRISGEYRSEATGLSCYYSYNGDEDDLSGYYTVGASEAFKHLYTYAVYGSLPDDGLEYLENIGLGRPEDIADNYYPELDNHPLTVSEIGDAVLNIGGEYAELLKSIYFTFCYLDSDSDTLFMLGTDNDIYSDWENGVFTDNFRGVWGGINGNICYMELVGNGDGYNLYSVPILLNGSEYNLRVSYDYAEGTYTIAVDIGSGEVRRVKSDNAENMSALCDIIRGVDLAVAVHIAVNNHDEFVDNVAFGIIQRIHIARRHITGGFLFTFCVQQLYVVAASEQCAIFRHFGLFVESA